MKKRVTGIGGLFFKSKDPKAAKDWYNKHSGGKIKKEKIVLPNGALLQKILNILNLLKKTLCLTTE